MLDLVIDRRPMDLGGFEVGRVLPFAKRRMVGPFIFLDHMGPARFERGLSRKVDVRPHPHIGLSTVTYLFSGEIVHRDSLGYEQAIRPGEVNWMTAGCGITHSERFERARAQGDFLHGLQSWVALPDEHEETGPSFEHYGEGLLPESRDGGAWMRVIAGEPFGVKSRVKTHSPLFYLHWQLDAGAIVVLPGNYAERAVYVVTGSIEIDGRTFEAGKLLVFSRGADVKLRALTPAVVTAFGGEPIGERFIEWNFVSSSRERIRQAKEDWRAQRMKLPDRDNAEFIPLPADAMPPPNPAS
jgi:redox-sensitive bicupin YhaK (pirin superfamily)